jgi:hypothetical protein
VSAVFGTTIFALNLNILYLQSTAMTELLLISTMTLSAYELVKWHEDENIITLVKTAFWIMLSTLIRYDGWFLLFNVACLVVLHALLTKRKNLKEAVKYAEGLFFLLLPEGQQPLILQSLIRSQSHRICHYVL